MILEVILLVFVYMILGFITALIKKNNGIVDTLWGIGFILIALFTLIRTGSYMLIHILMTMLVIIWGFRLSYHIHKRNKGKPEDFRYAQWRKDWGKWVNIRAFFQVFMLQGFLMLLIALPIYFVNTSVEYLSLFTYLGAAVWIFGFVFESVGDYQLKQFIKNKKSKGKIMTSGLWKYTRHPNYFGEAVQWWGLAIIALPISLWAFVSPILITFLLLKVSGVPMLEKKWNKNKEYQKYKKRTNAFFPWFSKQ